MLLHLMVKRSLYLNKGMKLRQLATNLLEARYAKPLTKYIEPKIPEKFRTKHGLKRFLQSWKERLREALWDEWNTHTHRAGTDLNFEDFYEYIRYSAPERIIEIIRSAPLQLEQLFDGALEEVLEHMRHEVAEDEEFEKNDEEW